MDWREVLYWSANLSRITAEDLKAESNTDNSFDRNNNNNEDDDEEEGDDGIVKTNNTNNVAEKQPNSTDGPPDDIRAFYGHPLTAATASSNDADTHASAVALLHEYINLPALDRSGMKIGDKINSIYDIMRDDGSSAKVETGNEGDGDYMHMLQTTLASEVDKFFNRECGENATISIITENGACPVTVAEEVAHEVCVETSGLPTDNVDATELYVAEPVQLVQTLDNTTSISDPKLLSMAMPSLEENMRSNNIPVQACSATKTSTVSASMPYASEKVRRAREPKEQVNVKTQEISKKLVKALTEKIMKRMSQKDNETISEASEIESAVANLPPQGRASATINNLESHINESASVNKVTVEQNHETILENLPENLPIIEAGNLDASPVPVTTFISSGLTSSAPQQSSSPLSPTKDLKKSQNCTQTNLVNVSQTIESASVTRVSPPVYCKNNAAAHAQALVTKQSQFMRHNSLPASNQNSYQAYNSNTVLNTCRAPNGAPAPVYYFPDVSNGSFNIYQTQVRPTIPGTSDCDIMLERYIQQQTPYSHENPNLRARCKDGYSLKSPDSGFCEPCVSPREPNLVQYSDSSDLKEYADGFEDEAEKRGGKVAKRRKSAPPMYVKQYWNPMDKMMKSNVLKLEKDPAGYKYFLDCPISTTQRIEEDRITYLNKGQYYGLTLEHDGQRTIKNQTLKSVIMVVFREDKHLDDERKAWEFWHSRQHSYKQRVIDIDTKNSINVGSNCTEEISYNAVAVKWNARDSPVKVNIAVHCLSTDFSNQKGVKGLPLHIQVDTYENPSKDASPISRGYCQIKVFCDKGAERKIRDEERRKQCRVNKTETQPGTKALRRRHEEVYHEALERSEFYPMADLLSEPILFTPTFECNDSARPSPVNVSVTDEDGSSSITSSVEHYDSAEDGISPAKRPRTDSYVPYQSFTNILLYVREKHEVVFTAIMLRSPTLNGLLQAVEEKYKVPMSKIKNSYKRSKKGMLVRMDDNIIRHYSHESTFIIELKKKDDVFELILTEIDPC
ncbi:uncharacterized protein LOC132712748 isoform X2 [Ruditapes philippinarum]|uniref:uncharacterized protein LOC132712748 isoform X2 n=1 Tax=Ruditapes philippinarum TaxID=129788 RepID=UPI00295ACF1A|nr:uncharacterized protein LOC132712748 isoform X2 [Ruditapes philippinarum]